jgi:hypothetical protein
MRLEQYIQQRPRPHRPKALNSSRAVGGGVWPQRLWDQLRLQIKMSKNDPETGKIVEPLNR